jgi:antitoxin component of MazEF toxin-antitoxin module
MDVELTIKNRLLVVAPARTRYRLADLLRRVKSKSLHAASWSGGPVGKEQWIGARSAGSLARLSALLE